MPIHKSVCRRIIQLIIKHRSSPIFYSVFESGHSYDDDKGNGADAWIRGTEDWEYLADAMLEGRSVTSEWKTYTENDDEEEVNIGDVMELKEQVHRDKAQGCVLCCPDFIPSIIDEGMTFLIPRVVRQRHVEVYLPLLRLRLQSFRITGRTRKASASSRFAFLLCVRIGLVKPVEDRLPLVQALVAFRSLCGPSLPFGRFGMGIPSKLYYRHRGWGCAGLGINFLVDLTHGT
jgi:hypothetical protein